MTAFQRLLAPMLGICCVFCLSGGGLGAETAYIGLPPSGASGGLVWAHIESTTVGSARHSSDRVVACLVSPTKLSDEEIARFLASPGGLLMAFPLGGLRLSDRVRSLVGSSSATLQPIVSLVPGASQAQRTAIGAGLARTVAACQAGQLDFATQIQDAAASIGDNSFLTAFAGALGSERIGAIGPGAAPGGSNGGSFSLSQTGQFGAANGFTEGGSQFVTTEVESFSVGSAGSFTTTSVSPF